MESLLSNVGERIKATASVKAVYGEPQVVAGRTIIPVASVSYGFGAGSGRQGGESEGGGGGGGVRVKPIAILEVSEKQTKVVPILDVNRLALFGLIALFLAVVVGRRRNR